MTFRPRLALAADLPRAESDWDRHRLDGDTSQQFVQEALPADVGGRFCRGVPRRGADVIPDGTPDVRHCPFRRRPISRWLKALPNRALSIGLDVVAGDGGIAASCRRRGISSRAKM